MVGAGAVFCTIVIHALALSATVNYLHRQTRRGGAHRAYLVEFITVVQVMSFAFVAHTVEVALWARLFMIVGEFHEFGTAYYHSAVNYTTLGYGDVLMTPSWRLDQLRQRRITNVWVPRLRLSSPSFCA